MLDDKIIEQSVRDIIIEICEVMHRHGFESVSVGAIMRLMGLPEERVIEHDHEWFDLGPEFDQLLQARRELGRVPPDTTLH